MMKFISHRRDAKRTLSSIIGSLLALVPALCVLAPALAGTGTITMKDAGGISRTFNVVTDGTGNFTAYGVICDGAATAQCATVSPGGSLHALDDNSAALLAAAQAGTGTTGAAVPASGILGGCVESNVEVTAGVANGQLRGVVCGLGGKQITYPFSVKELQLRGSADSTVTTPVTIIPLSATQKIYITDWECSNTAATQATLTFNDSATTKIIVPAGGGNNKSLGTPLVTSAINTAFTFTQIAPAQTTVTCAAQGYYAL
jgi:hypothetical protein